MLWCWAACSGLAGWQTNDVWPSDQYLLHVDEADRVTVTNLYGQHHVETWTQVCTNQFGQPASIPALSTLLPDIPGYSGPIAATTNSTRCWTNEYWTDVQTDLTAGELAAFAGTNWYTNVYALAASTNDAVTNALTTTVCDVMAGGQISWKLDVPDLWGYDLYASLRERQEAVGVGTLERPRYYRGLRATLVSCKEWIAYAVDDQGLFVRTTALVDGTLDSWFSTAVGGVYPTAAPVWAMTNLLADAGAPTNWHAHTPWRDLGGYTAGEGHIVTTAYTIAAGAGLTVTNAVIDYCGNARTISGTNGQVVVLSCTNIVLDGFTESDYGFRHATAIVARLTVTTHAATLAAKTTMDCGSGCYTLAEMDAAWSNRTTALTDWPGAMVDASTEPDGLTANEGAVYGISTFTPTFMDSDTAAWTTETDDPRDYWYGGANHYWRHAISLVLSSGAAPKPGWNDTTVNVSYNDQPGNIITYTTTGSGAWTNERVIVPWGSYLHEFITASGSEEVSGSNMVTQLDYVGPNNMRTRQRATITLAAGPSTNLMSIKQIYLHGRLPGAWNGYTCDSNFVWDAWDDAASESYVLYTNRYAMTLPPWTNAAMPFEYPFMNITNLPLRGTVQCIQRGWAVSNGLWVLDWSPALSYK